MENNLINDSGHCIKEKYLKKKDIDLYNSVIKFNIDFNDIPWIQMVYNYINNISSTPKCSCGHLLNFVSFKVGYRKYCSVKCAVNSDEFKLKKEKTLLKNYGVKNISQSKNIKLKKEKTLLKNYGVTHPLKSKTIKHRIIQTNINHWGVENVSQSSVIAEKKKETTLKNYGVEYNFQSDKIKKDISDTIHKNHGVDYYVQSLECKSHIKNSVNKRRIDFWANKLNIDVSNIIISGDTFIINNYCKYHNSFQINRYNLYNRAIVGSIENICTICNPISESSSIKEIEIRKFIEEELNFNTEKIRINNKEIDIYIPNKKIGIEFNGLYWHSDINKDKNYHLNKTEECEKQGIQLLHIFEDEWIYKKDIIKSIIKSKLGIIENKIFARKCEIKEIDSKLSSSFLNNNHLQGSVNSSIKIGLFSDNQLVGLMTFGKKRVAMGHKKNGDGEYEMLRFCNKLNTQVIGGASKLLKYFIKQYNPKEILTFADRRYSNGDLYQQLGFKFVANTKPNYFYFKTSEMIRYHRYNFRKNVLVKEGYDQTKTEYQIMTERGYLKIYDCGHIKFQISF